jgi:hypothetical protein
MVFIVAIKIVLLHSFTFSYLMQSNDAARSQNFLFPYFQSQFKPLSLIWEPCWAQITEIFMDKYQEHS